MGRIHQLADGPGELCLIEVAHDAGLLADQPIWPFSSDTTTTIASVCSAMPSAARCLVPKRSASTVVSASGNSTPAASKVSPRMTTAPSWSAVRGEKIVRIRSAETSP